MFCMFVFILLGIFDTFYGKNMFQEAADSIGLGHRINTQSGPKSKLQCGAKPGQTCYLK